MVVLGVGDETAFAAGEFPAFSATDALASAAFADDPNCLFNRICLDGVLRTVVEMR